MQSGFIVVIAAAVLMSTPLQRTTGQAAAAARETITPQDTNDVLRSCDQCSAGDNDLNATITRTSLFESHLHN